MDSPAPASPSPSPAMEGRISTPPYRKQPSISPSPLHLSNYTSIPIRELLSPSPKRRQKTSRAQIHEENHEQVVSLTPRKKRRGRAASMVVAAASGFPGGCMNASPRASVRRARRRLEKEIVVVREEKERENAEEEGGVKVRKKRQCKAKKADRAESQGRKEDLSLVPYVAPTKAESHVQDAGASNEQTTCSSGICDLIYELIMWKNIAKSTLWFGFGSMFFFSTSFSRDLNFSMISSVCHLGVFILGLAFIRDSIPKRQQVKSSVIFQLTEQDILRLLKILLPFFNAAILKAQMVFCGDPSTTLKMLPILLFGAKYGHLITLWRLFAAGFFVSFTLPKLFSRYSQQIHKRVESMRDRAIEAWRNCPRKRFVAASAVTMFWNLFSIKTRIITAFVSLVIFRYHNQQNNGEEELNGENGEIEIEKQDEKLEMEMS